MLLFFIARLVDDCVLRASEHLTEHLKRRTVERSSHP
jgi:hypothetical protein